GVAFLPMHWGEMNARGGRSNNLTQTAIDPISKEPEFKHSAVQIKKFIPAWRGMMLMAGNKLTLGRQMIKSYTYGVVGCAGTDHPVTSVELACSKTLKYEQHKRLDQLLEQGQSFETLTYSDRKHGIHRKAWLNDGHLMAVRWVGGDIHEAKWLRKLMLEARDVGELRPYLLAPGGPVDKQDTKGHIICACNHVGELELKAAIEAGSDSLERLKSYTMAGTGCGSCVPEMKRLLQA
ncbi:MAG: (2Fe-2S)-binding protein, partial [Mariprofundaceae bacterium]|nr:(2Fe-2S)-binding protein [Mariprofundaceae bacterium]